MEKQTITNGIDLITITKDDALKLELKINLYENKDYWREIGDKLYDFHAKNINTNINVTNDQNKIMLRILKN
tara:strand:- start:174 stop:389 length:216 start_codon:yes stop_codon:yes gene_type:complete